MSNRLDDLPIVVVGGGPVGLVAAVHLIDKRATPLVLEAGTRVGSNVLAWGHVRMFSPWEFNVDPVAGAMLEAAGWLRPLTGAYPTGQDLVDHYLAPLAELLSLRPCIRLGARVTAISRLGRDRMKSAGRDEVPFVVHATIDGREEAVLARAVIDASGTLASPNPLGASGVPAIGEAGLREWIFYGIPDVLGLHRLRYAGRRVLVVGSGHSAFNVLLDLVELARSVPGMRVLWAIRRAEIEAMFGGGEADQLPERGRLGLRIRAVVDQSEITPVPDFRLARLTRTSNGIVAASETQELPAVDEVVATTGFRPDLQTLGELRLALDPVLESPVALAPVIDPNVHSCGTVPPHGEEVLRHPEPRFYMAGMKSYGRAPNFLMLTGYEQVRSIACALTGDWEGARSVHLSLPATGVCSGGLLAAPKTARCCAPQLAQVPERERVSAAHAPAVPE